MKQRVAADEKQQIQIGFRIGARVGLGKYGAFKLR
jgi:hypothetical protein